MILYFQKFQDFSFRLWESHQMKSNSSEFMIDSFIFITLSVYVTNMDMYNTKKHFIQTSCCYILGGMAFITAVYEEVVWTGLQRIIQYQSIGKKGFQFNWFIWLNSGSFKVTDSWINKLRDNSNTKILGRQDHLQRLGFSVRKQHTLKKAPQKFWAVLLSNP